MGAKTQGVHHVGLTVTDVEAARAFFVDVLGFEATGGRPTYPAIFVTDGTVIVTLWRAADPGSARAFDRKNAIGLHHLALRVESIEALHALHETLASHPDVTVEFAPEPLGMAGAQHMMFAGPSGVRIELVWAPS